jgi:hypothetical protein
MKKYGGFAFYLRRKLGQQFLDALPLLRKLKGNHDGYLSKGHDINHLRAFPTVSFALGWREIKGVNLYDLFAFDVNPVPAPPQSPPVPSFLGTSLGGMSTRASGGIERLHQRLDFGFNVVKEGLHLRGLGACQLIFGDKPSYRVQIHACH